MDLNEKQQYILDNFDRALQEKWIAVYYQPIVRSVNGCICDEEALARWIDPVKGFLSPADFIPVLEESKQIYKLDLYVLDQILVDIKFMAEQGYYVVPQSLNLSRSDFDMCDIVEEVCKRVDGAGVSRDKITIEITEGALVNDFDFMLSQIERFKKLGFSVWMDDFGSGYSSLNTLQRIPFDLIKFDMAFMRNLDSGTDGKILLSELMRMASALGKDTVCEGVETKEQVSFLQEIGCSKLQGYFFSKPISMEEILEKSDEGIYIEYENPKETHYCEEMGRVNLYDLSVIAKNENNYGTFFNTLPMSVIEMNERTVRFTRSNPSYREFMEKYFSAKISDEEVLIKDVMQGPGSLFMLMVKQAAKEGKRLFVDEILPDGSKAYYMLSKLAENPVDKKVAVVVAVLSISDASQGETYENIARALASDYFSLYYVNLETEEFIEYTSNVGDEELSTERHGNDFFNASRRDALIHLHEADQANFIINFTKENIIKSIEEQGTFVLTYRLMRYGLPCYVSLKAMPMQKDKKRIIIGVSNVDQQMKQKMQLEQAKQDQIVYSRIMALSGDYICIYIINLKDNSYIEHHSNSEFQSLGIDKSGHDFFADSQMNADKAVYEEDREEFKKIHTKEYIMRSIEKEGVFTSTHRLLINGEPVRVFVRCVLVKENGTDKLVMGVRKG